jgi:AraC family transcriptional regulator
MGKRRKKMLPREISPRVLRHGRTAQGLSCELRWDPQGMLELPGLKEVLVAIHMGPSAKLSCRRGGKQYGGTAVHGDIDIIPAHTIMRWEMHDQNDTSLILGLPHTLLRSVAHELELDPARMEIRNRFQVRDSELETLSWAIKREMELGRPSGRVYLDGLTLAIASRLVTRHSSLTKGVEQRYGGLTGHRLKQVLSFIEEQLGDDLSLERVAAVARVSPSHLNSLFRGSVGLSVHKYVIRRRVERAKTLLQQDGLSLTEVALAAGFAHPSHMARHMRRLLGLPPRAIKRVLETDSVAR